MITRKVRFDSRFLRRSSSPSLTSIITPGSCTFIAGGRSRFDLDFSESLAPSSGTCFGILRRFVILLPPKRCVRLAVQEDSRT